MSLLTRLIAAVTIVAIAAAPAAAAPAAATQPPVTAQQPVAAPHDEMRAYVGRIPVGSRVKIALADGKRLRGVLMLVEGDVLVVRERKRRPEPPLRIPLANVADVELDQNGGGVARAVAIGAGVGAGAALAVIAFLAAMIDD